MVLWSLWLYTIRVDLFSFSIVKAYNIDILYLYWYLTFMGKIYRYTYNKNINEIYVNIKLKKKQTKQYFFLHFSSVCLCICGCLSPKLLNRFECVFHWCIIASFSYNLEFSFQPVYKYKVKSILYRIWFKFNEDEIAGYIWSK